jgi:hypothetical protein
LAITYLSTTLRDRLLVLGDSNGAVLVDLATSFVADHYVLRRVWLGEGAGIIETHVWKENRIRVLSYGATNSSKAKINSKGCCRKEVLRGRLLHLRRVTHKSGVRLVILV